MPNTSFRRLENCCVPPKKFAWRFDNAEHSPSELQFVEPLKINNHNMGLMSDDREVKPVAEIKDHPLVETFSHTKHEQLEDAPLDFSLKTGGNPTTKTESVNYLMKPIVKDDLKEGGNNMINHAPIQMSYSSRMLNGNNSPPSPNRSPALLNTSHATSSSKDSDSIDMECSQESDKSPSHSLANCVSRVDESYENNSPFHPDLSRENSPVSQTSILEGMLRGQKQSNTGIAGRPQAFGAGYGAGFGIFENQIIGSPSPPMTMNAPVIHPNMIPLSMGPYFGYFEHPNPFVPGYMYKHPESNMSDTSAIRKPKKKSDPLTDSLKACSVDELRQKLDSLSGNSLGLNSDYTVNLKPSYIPQGDNVRRFTNNVSQESVKNASSDINKREDNEKDNAVPSHNQIVNKGNALVNHNKEHNTSVNDISPIRNSENTTNRNEANSTNNVANVSFTEDTNDSIHSAISESPDGRKRKSIPDYKNDPLYKIKRAKNNLAARRSRESRRIKEELIRKTANILEQQNKVILRDLTALKFSFDESQVKYFTLLKEYENMKIQNSVLVERLNQKRCGQCGTALPSIS